MRCLNHKLCPNVKYENFTGGVLVMRTYSLKRDFIHFHNPLVHLHRAMGLAMPADIIGWDQLHAKRDHNVRFIHKEKKKAKDILYYTQRRVHSTVHISRVHASHTMTGLH